MGLILPCIGPKKAIPEGVNDFQPISLTNVKFLTKLAANRLQGKILQCIHKNQYGFLKNRSISKIVLLGHLNTYIFVKHPRNLL
jgi:hypothetical protein